MKVIVASGYFDPIHSGHLQYLEAAAKLGDRLIVIVNNDAQAILKKGRPFMLAEERREIVAALRCVSEAVISFDKDSTVRKTLEDIYPDVFAKGGDSTLENVPEKEICERLGIELVMGVGGGKIQSSSELLKHYGT